MSSSTDIFDVNRKKMWGISVFLSPLEGSHIFHKLSESDCKVKVISLELSKNERERLSPVIIQQYFKKNFSLEKVLPGLQLNAAESLWLFDDEHQNLINTKRRYLSEERTFPFNNLRIQAMGEGMKIIRSEGDHDICRLYLTEAEVKEAWKAGRAFNWILDGRRVVQREEEYEEMKNSSENLLIQIAFTISKLRKRPFEEAFSDGTEICKVFEEISNLLAVPSEYIHDVIDRYHRILFEHLENNNFHDAIKEIDLRPLQHIIESILI